MRRTLIALFSIVVIGGLALPAVLPRSADSFPVSMYPMYAADRSDVIVLPTAVLRTAGGGSERLSIGEIANTDDPLIAAALLRDAIDTQRADQLCAEIAERVDQSGTIEVVDEQHDLVAFVGGAKTPLRVEVHASCAAS